MTTVVALRTSDHRSTITDTIATLADPAEPVYLVRLGGRSSVVRPADRDRARGLACAIGVESSEPIVDALVGFADAVDADQIGVEVRDRTPTGKARVDDLVQDLLLHDEITGDLRVHERLFVFATLDYDRSSG